MVWTCRAQHRLDCRSTQAECGCTEKIWQAKEIMGWGDWEWQKEARYGFCWPSEPFWVERTPARKTCQKAQPSVEENRALKWIWYDDDDVYGLVAIPVPSYFECPEVYTLHTHPLAYRQIHTSVCYYQYSFFPITVVLWNRLPADLVLNPDLDSFQAGVRKISHAHP